MRDSKWTGSERMIAWMMEMIVTKPLIDWQSQQLRMLAEGSCPFTKRISFCSLRAGWWAPASGNGDVLWLSVPPGPDGRPWHEQGCPLRGHGYDRGVAGYRSLSWSGRRTCFCRTLSWQEEISSQRDYHFPSLPASGRCRFTAFYCYFFLLGSNCGGSKVK